MTNHLGASGIQIDWGETGGAGIFDLMTSNTSSPPPHCAVHPRCSSSLCIHQEQSGLPYRHIVHTDALYYNIRKKCMYSVLKWTIDTLWTGHKYTHYHIMLKADQPHYTAHCPFSPIKNRLVGRNITVCGSQGVNHCQFEENVASPFPHTACTVRFVDFLV